MPKAATRATAKTALTRYSMIYEAWASTSRMGGKKTTALMTTNTTHTPMMFTSPCHVAVMHDTAEHHARSGYRRTLRHRHLRRASDGSLRLNPPIVRRNLVSSTTMLYCLWCSCHASCICTSSKPFSEHLQTGGRECMFRAHRRDVGTCGGGERCEVAQGWDARRNARMRIAPPFCAR